MGTTIEETILVCTLSSKGTTENKFSNALWRSSFLRKFIKRCNSFKDFFKNLSTTKNVHFFMIIYWYPVYIVRLCKTVACQKFYKQ